MRQQAHWNPGMKAATKDQLIDDIQDLKAQIDELKRDTIPRAEAAQIVREILERRINGFMARADSIYNGKIIAEELQSNSRDILARLMPEEK